MIWPAPLPGMIINYSFLWSGEAKLGREEGVKDRPCAVVIASRDDDGNLVVRVLPVTHRPPLNADDAVEIPLAVKNRLGLDDAPSWIVLTELNEFPWPGPDLRPVRGKGNPVFGFLPNNFFRHVLIQLAKRRVRVTKRT